MTHAENVQRARDAVVEAAKAEEMEHAKCSDAPHWATCVLCPAVHDLQTLEAKTCQTCSGNGYVWGQDKREVFRRDPCPANCDVGKVRQ
jgi:hypothetical protein